MEKAFCCGCLISLESLKALRISTICDVKKSLTYADCLKICTNIDLHYKYNICEFCIVELKTSYKFYKRTMKSYHVLKKLEKKYDVDGKTHHGLVRELAVKSDAEGCSILKNLSFVSVEQEVPPGLNEKVKEVDRAVTFLENTLNNIDSSEGEIFETETLDLSNEGLSNPSGKTSICDETIFQQLEIIPVESRLNSKHPTNLINQQANTDKPRKRFFGKFSCDYCDKLFPNHSRMVIHRRSHESDRPKFNCKECGRIYSTNQALEVHIRSVHQLSGYACKVCPKVFPVKASLTVHMRFHTKNFPFICETCGHKFAQICHLNTHRNVKHNSVRFCCSHPNCGKFFTSSASLRNHDFSHGLMPFECEFCHGGYPSKSKLKTHVRRAHKNNLTLEELEPMRIFHVMRSKPNIMQLNRSPFEENNTEN